MKITASDERYIPRQTFPKKEKEKGHISKKRSSLSKESKVSVFEMRQGCMSASLAGPTTRHPPAGIPTPIPTPRNLERQTKPQQSPGSATHDGGLENALIRRPAPYIVPCFPPLVVRLGRSRWSLLERRSSTSGPGLEILDPCVLQGCPVIISNEVMSEVRGTAH